MADSEGMIRWERPFGRCLKKRRVSDGVLSLARVLSLVVGAIFQSGGAAADFETLSIHVRGTALSVERAGGRGPVVVLISGAGEPRESWRPLIDLLAPCARVISYDRAGTGKSERLWYRRLTAAQAAGDLATLLAALQVEEPVMLVGHSIGGLYAQVFARTHPLRTAALVLVDTATPLEPPGVFVPTAPLRPGTPEAAEEAGVAASMAMLRRSRLLPDVPVIVLVAQNHQDTPEREALWRTVQARTAALARRGELRLVEGSGHFIQKDRPAAVFTAVRDAAASAARPFSCAADP